MVNYSKQGKRNRQKGLVFENKVRGDLENKGWIVTKWMNTVDFERDCVTAAKRKYNPFTKALAIGTGFPDFLCFKKNENSYDILGVEVKTNGSLDKFERGQGIWYIEKGILPNILIAKKKKIKNRVTIEYSDFRKRYLEKKKKETPKNIKTKRGKKIHKD
jgi:hypothetical protein